MNASSQSILDSLNASVVAHWQAIRAYTEQAAFWQRAGYSKLTESARGDAEEERGHLVSLLDRLEFLDADFGTAPAPVGRVFWPRDLNGILAANLIIETNAAQIERAGILSARLSGDEGTADVFADKLEGSESSIREIEAAQRAIAAMGLDNYLASML